MILIPSLRTSFILTSMPVVAYHLHSDEFGQHDLPIQVWGIEVGVWLKARAYDSSKFRDVLSKLCMRTIEYLPTKL